MTHCFLLECCTKTHIDDYLRFVFAFFLFFVLISAFPLYFVAFCQRLIYEYMDMDMESHIERSNSVESFTVPVAV